jgi:hypothetical protein
MIGSELPNKITHAGGISCNSHGHHNRVHCTITHLNTRNPGNYASRKKPLHRSDNPLPEPRAGIKNTDQRVQTHQNLFTLTKNYRSSTNKLGANIQPDTRLTFAGTAAKPNRNSNFPVQTSKRFFF